MADLFARGHDEWSPAARLMAAMAALVPEKKITKGESHGNQVYIYVHIMGFGRQSCAYQGDILGIS